MEEKRERLRQMLIEEMEKIGLDIKTDKLNRKQKDIVSMRLGERLAKGELE